MTGSGGAYLPVWLLVIAAIGGLAIPVWGWRTLLLRYVSSSPSQSSPGGIAERPSYHGERPRWEELADVAGIRYWFLPSLMFLWERHGARGAEEQYCAICRGCGFVADDDWGCSKMALPAVSETHFSADVEPFKNLKTGEHMLFAVYDPDDRKMELIKR